MLPSNDAYVHKPYSWINVEKILASNLQYYWDLAPQEYCLAISVPLESTIKTLLKGNPESVAATSCDLPRINSDVLDNPSELAAIINSLETQREQDPGKKMHEMKGRIEEAMRSGSTLNINMFPQVKYSISWVDVQALAVVAQFDKFINSIKNGDTSQALLDLGFIYLYWAFIADGGESFQMIAKDVHVMNSELIKSAHRFSGGRSTKEKSARERQAIKAMALEELMSNSYQSIKMNKLPKSIHSGISVNEFIPWGSHNFAAEITLPRINSRLEKAPINSGVNMSSKARNRVSKNTYLEVVKEIAQEQPSLFRKK